MNRLIKNTLAIALLSNLLVGCANVDNFSTPPAHSGLSGLTANAQDISHHLQLANNRLAIVALQGGKDCLPATIWTINKTLKQATQSLNASLVIDAANAVILAEKQLQIAEQRMAYLTARTPCATELTAQPAQQSKLTYVKSNQVQTNSENKDSALGIIPLLLNSNNQFASDQAKLTVSYKNHLQMAAKLIQQAPAIAIVLSGHTDDIGSSESNIKLSQARVAAVKQQLVDFGVDSNIIEKIAKGESTPISDNNDATGRLANRRVNAEIQLITSNSNQSIEQKPLTLKDWWQALAQPSNKFAIDASNYPHVGR